MVHALRSLVRPHLDHETGSKMHPRMISDPHRRTSESHVAVKIRMTSQCSGGGVAGKAVDAGADAEIRSRTG